jgi:hypothetical protein
MRVPNHLALAAAATLAGTMTLVGVAGSSAGATPPKAGIVHVYDVNPTVNGGAGTIVITGVIADTGQDQQVGPGTNRLTLSKGSFEVNTTAIGKAFSKAKPDINPKNCGVVLAASAPVTLSGGTGAYQGIRGRIVLHVTNSALLPVKADGTCNEDPDSLAVGEVTIDEGQGNVSFAD